jgi:hypothetical protein
VSYGAVRCFTVSYGVVRCFTVSYGVVRCRTVLCPFAGPCVVRCLYGVETVRDVRCARLWAGRPWHLKPAMWSPIANHPAALMIVHLTKNATIKRRREALGLMCWIKWSLFKLTSTCQAQPPKQSAKRKEKSCITICWTHSSIAGPSASERKTRLGETCTLCWA